MDPLAAKSRNVDGFSDFGDTSHGNEHLFGEETDITKPENVAYVLPGLGAGGTEKHVLDLAERIDRRRFSPLVVSTAGGGHLEGEVRASGIPVHVLEYRGLSLSPGKAGPLYRDARAFFRTFSDILRKEEVRIVHSYLPAANVLGTIVATTCRTPVKIVSKRALCRYKEGHPVFSRFENLANLAADAVMVNSLAVAEDVRRTERFVGKKMFLVYNGIDAAPSPSEGLPPSPPADLGIPSDAVLIPYVANIREDKAHLCLVDAARSVAAACPSARILFVGREGSEAAPVREKIRALGLEETVLLAGPRRDVPSILASSRIVAHPGEQEGFSNAILEAMAAGLPVVASRAGGNPEAVVEGETGFLVSPGDAKAFAQAILRLIEDPGLAKRMGDAGRRRVAERFSLVRMVADLELVYEELLEGRPLSLLAPE